MSDLQKYIAEDLLMPIDQLGGLSFFALENSADQGEGILFDAARELAVDGQCYALLGDGALSQMGTTCLLFNHTLLETLLPDAADLYTAVKSGEWTWDRLLALLSAAEAAGVKDSEEGASGEAEPLSLFGTTLSEDALSAAIYKSFDTDLSEDAAAGSFYLSATETLQTLARIETVTGGDAKTAFRDGELLFLVTTLDALYDYTDADGSWGCLPLPKRNEEAAGYVSMLDPDSTCVYVALKNSLRLETKGNYLLASCAVAKSACLPTFVYELLADYIREGSALDMIPYILAGAAAEKAFVTPDSDAFARLAAVLAGAALPSETPSDAAG